MPCHAFVKPSLCCVCPFAFVYTICEVKVFEYASNISAMTIPFPGYPFFLSVISQCDHLFRTSFACCLALPSPYQNTGTSPADLRGTAQRVQETTAAARNLIERKGGRRCQVPLQHPSRTCGVEEDNCGHETRTEFVAPLMAIQRER